MTTTIISQPAAGYAGDVTPQHAWELAQRGVALIVDVRSPEESSFVGRVPNSVLVPWAVGVGLDRNPHFLAQLQQFDRHQPLLLLCRSARRSVSAALAATEAGFTQVYNILEGFEGDKDANSQRGHLAGWRLRGLPWLQD